MQKSMPSDALKEMKPKRPLIQMNIWRTNITQDMTSNSTLYCTQTTVKVSIIMGLPLPLSIK